MTSSAENQNKEVTLAVTVTTTGPSGEVLASVNTSGKLTKADAGRVGVTEEDWICIRIEPGVDGTYKTAKVSIDAHSKETISNA